MKQERFMIAVDDVERRILVKALSDLKDQQKANNRNYDFIDELIVRVCEAESSKGKSKNHVQR